METIEHLEYLVKELVELKLTIDKKNVEVIDHQVNATSKDNKLYHKVTDILNRASHQINNELLKLEAKLSLEKRMSKKENN